MSYIFSRMKPLLVFILFILLSTTSFCQISDKDGSFNLGTNYALVVGISSYPNIKQLLYADDDAELFADYLRTEGVCYKKNILLLIDSAATTANFYRELNKIGNKIKPNDRVFIYFAGHGGVETDLESGFLLTYNCEKNNYAATSIDIAMLERYVKSFTNKQANVVLITDACRSGNLAGGLTGTAITLNSLTKGFNNTIKLLSCQPNQLSQEKAYIDGGHGIFTYHLVDALKGLADKNGDKLITLRELDLYMDSVSAETKQKQIPRVEGNPTSVIFSYKDTIKSALINQKKNKSQSNFLASRNIGSNEYDSNLFYRTFVEQIKNRRLINPDKNNALNTIENAILNQQNADLIEDMKFELVAVIEDEVQKYIHRYLRGEDKNGSFKISSENYLNLLNKCIFLVNKENPRYDEIEAKRNFFNARYEFYNNNVKRFPSLIEELKKSLETLGNQAWITNLIGNLYFEIGKVDSSEYYFVKSAEYSPTWAYPIANLSWNYHLLGNEEKALELLRKALMLDSANSWVLSAIGEVFLTQQKINEARFYTKQAYEIDSTDVHLLQLLGNIHFNLREYDSSAFYYSKAIEKDSFQIESWFGLAKTNYFKKEFEIAEYAYNNAIKIDSLYAYAWIGLAYINSAKNNKEVALKYCYKALSIEPKIDDSWLIIKNLDTAFDTAFLENCHMKIIDKLTKDSLDYNSINSLAGVEFLFHKNYNKAEKYYLKALEIKPTNYYVWYNLACVYSITKKIERSFYYLENAIKIGYSDFNSINTDPDLSNLRKEKEFNLLIKKYKSRL